MAREEAPGARSGLTTAADIHALGAILDELLTGRPPFQADNVLDTLLKLREEKPPPPRSLHPGVDADLETICLKCLEKEPQRRYTSAANLAEDLRRFLADEPILARPVGPAERLRRWCRRNPRLAALSAAVAALLVAAALLVTVAITSTAFAVELARERDDTERQRQAAVEARDLADRRAEELEAARRLADENAGL